MIKGYDLTLYTYLSPSKVCGGVGVFSLVDILQDTVIFKPRWQVQVKDSTMPDKVRDYLDKMTYDGWVDDDLQHLGQQYYINHSHSPNVAYDKTTGKLYAIRDIKKGEELTDYYFPGERDWLT